MSIQIESPSKFAAETVEVILAFGLIIMAEPIYCWLVELFQECCQ